MAISLVEIESMVGGLRFSLVKIILTVRCSRLDIDSWCHRLASAIVISTVDRFLTQYVHQTFEKKM